MLQAYLGCLFHAAIDVDKAHLLGRDDFADLHGPPVPVLVFVGIRHISSDWWVVYEFLQCLLTK